MSRWVPDIRDWHRWHSIRWNIAGVVLIAITKSAVLAAGAVPFVAIFNDDVVLYVLAAIFVGSIIGRLLLQERK